MAPQTGSERNGEYPEAFGIDMAPAIGMPFVAATETERDEVTDRDRIRRVIGAAAEIVTERVLFSVAEPDWPRLYEEFRDATLPAIREYRARRFPKQNKPPTEAQLLTHLL